MTILLAMLQRKGKFILPEDVAAAVLSQGADETRKELVRLMAMAHHAEHGRPKWAPLMHPWESLAWTLEEVARGLPA